MRGTTPIAPMWPAVRRPTPRGCSAPSRSLRGRRPARSRSSASAGADRRPLRDRHALLRSGTRSGGRDPADWHATGPETNHGDRKTDQGAIEKLVDLFHERHRRLYGHASPESDVEFMTLTVAAIGPMPRKAMPEIADGHGRLGGSLQRDPAGLLRGSQAATSNAPPTSVPDSGRTTWSSARRSLSRWIPPSWYPQARRPGSTSTGR